MAGREQPKRPKHQPLRTCLGCGAKRPKKELVRVVRLPSGAITLDSTGRVAGRGAYICPVADCLRSAVKGKKLERALEAPVPEEVFESLTRAVEAAAKAASPTGGPVTVPGAPTPSGSPSGRSPMKR